jgi:hypothetical protein
MNDHQDARPRRPALDPPVPRAGRELLLATAGHGPAGAGRGVFPPHPLRRLAALDRTVTGLTVAGYLAVLGLVPWAFGELIYQHPARWESGAARVALILAAVLTISALVLFGITVTRRDGPAAGAEHQPGGGYPAAGGLDEQAAALLRRAQDAIGAISSSAVGRAGLLAEPPGGPGLAAQEQDIAIALREQARLRRERARFAEEYGPARAGIPGAADREPGTAEGEPGAPEGEPGTADREPGAATADLLAEYAEAARRAEDSVAGRVAALERYAAEVRDADVAYLDWQRRAAADLLREAHQDLLARTAADVHGVSQIEAMSQRARAIVLALREMRE